MSLPSPGLHLHNGVVLGMEGKDPLLCHPIPLWTPKVQEQLRTALMKTAGFDNFKPSQKFCFLK